MKNFIENKKHIHLIGAGGSGMYPLAQILAAKWGKGRADFKLSGSDNNETATLQSVREIGVEIFIGHDEKNIEGADLIIYSAAIPQTNPEIAAAKSAGIEIRERAELLGLVSSLYSDAVCVSGTHGKTTVTSMITQIFLAAEIDVSAVIGGKLNALNGSGKAGTSDFIIIEACEYNDTFLHLFPDVSVVLNVDEDHIEYFKTMDNLRKSFTKFCGLSSKCIVYNGDDENTLKVIAGLETQATPKKISFGYNEGNKYRPMNPVRDSDGVGYVFDIYKDGEFWIKAKTSVAGFHNVLNSTSAAVVSDICGLSKENIIKGLFDFKGAGRRFEIKSQKDGVTIADDYAHHPDEIKVTLETAKNLGYKRVIAVHQPFTYSRTKHFSTEFAKVLEIADKVFLTEIQGGRETNDEKLNATIISSRISPEKAVEIIPDYNDMAKRVKEFAKEGDLIITLGCGDVYKISDILAKCEV